jgi:hypothetical protein
MIFFTFLHTDLKTTQKYCFINDTTCETDQKWGDGQVTTKSRCCEDYGGTAWGASSEGICELCEGREYTLTLID